MRVQCNCWLCVSAEASRRIRSDKLSEAMARVNLRKQAERAKDGRNTSEEDAE